MQFPIAISRPWAPLLALFGFRRGSLLELDGDTLHARFGSARAAIPIADITGVAPRRWPFYYGLGPKLGPDHGVSWVGSTAGVVRIDFASPRPLEVWGPFRSSAARCLIVSLEDPQGFIDAIAAARR